MDLLDAPSTLHELPSRPVDQVLMDRTGTVLTEVTGRGNQTFTKMILPDPVDHDPRRQGVFTAGNPLSQQLPTAANQPIEIRPVGIARNRTEEAGFHLFATQFEIATRQNIGCNGVL